MKHTIRARAKMIRISLLAAVCAFAGCATPVSYTSEPLEHYDRDTSYRVDDHPSGFTITVYYSRYQFIPETDAVSAAGKSALLSIAYDVADEIEKNDFNLNISRYISTATAEDQIDLAATHQDLVQITQAIEKATTEHNEFLKELGLPLLPAGAMPK